MYIQTNIESRLRELCNVCNQNFRYLLYPYIAQLADKGLFSIVSVNT